MEAINDMGFRGKNLTVSAIFIWQMISNVLVVAFKLLPILELFTSSSPSTVHQQDHRRLDPYNQARR